MKNVILIILLTLASHFSFSQDLSEVYSEVNDAVVMIFTESQEVVSYGGTTRKVNSQGLGSGFMISDKQLVTAEHVVTVAEDIKVKFNDGEVIPAKVISSFKASDIALLELMWPKKDARIVTLADSDQLKIGEQVFVIGAPFGLGHSLSSGYISGIIKDSDNKNPFTQAEFIQTDASINTGNSGGPMFNLEGEVIGVVSQILTKSGGFEGIGFASSSNMVNKLLLNRNIFWGGIDSQILAGDLAKAFNLPQETGVLVLRVSKYSPFGLLGIKGGTIEASIQNEKIMIGGDVILSFNDVSIELSDEGLEKLANAMEGIKEDDPYTLKIFRAGEIITLTNK